MNLRRGMRECEYLEKRGGGKREGKGRVVGGKAQQ